MTSRALLSMVEVSVRYGGVSAVNRVDLHVEDGSFVGLIGPNGAGKTTLIDAVCGFATYKGSISFDGRCIDRLRPFRRSRLGLARTFQGGELFDDLSVRENVLVGSYGGAWTGVVGEILRSRQADPPRRVTDLLEAFDLADDRDRPVEDLPVGSRKLVAVARALAGAPRLVLLDEPAAGLDSTESRHLGEMLRRLPPLGVSVVLVDHDVDLVLEVCDVVHVLDAGRIIASGTGREVRDDPVVREAYLGAPATEPAG